MVDKKTVTVAHVFSVILDVMFRFRTLAIGALIISGVLVNAQSRPSARTTSAETGLVGIKLYDSGTRVVNVYGSPDEILALSQNSAGGGGTGGPGSQGASGGAGGQGAGSAAATLNSNVPASPTGLIGDPFGTGDKTFMQLRAGGDGDGREGAGPNRGTSDAGAGAGGASADTNANRVIYTRWVYKRPNAHYSFVFDKFNRVVQIEALGLKDTKVKTRKGITFDMHFNDLIKRYGAPDAYEINGDNIVVRYLVKDRVAFRLSRTRPNTPHHVTGVVVAAGKA